MHCGGSLGYHPLQVKKMKDAVVDTPDAYDQQIETAKTEFK